LDHATDHVTSKTTSERFIDVSILSAIPTAIRDFRIGIPAEYAEFPFLIARLWRLHAPERTRHFAELKRDTRACSHREIRRGYPRTLISAELTPAFLIS
jgi:hypothetical protein